MSNAGGSTEKTRSTISFFVFIGYLASATSTLNTMLTYSPINFKSSVSIIIAPKSKSTVIAAASAVASKFDAIDS